MKQIHKIFLILLLLFPVYSLYALPGDFPPAPDAPKPPETPEEMEKRPERDFKKIHGKRIPEDDGKFEALFIKSMKTPDGIIFEVFFSQPVDANSVRKGSFLINDVEINTYARFSKSRLGFQIKIPEEQENLVNGKISVTIQNVRSINGQKMEKLKFEDFTLNKEYNFFKRDNQWKKF